MTYDYWFDILICALLSALGGAGRLLSAKTKKPLQPRMLAKALIVSVSIGVGVFFIIRLLIPAAKENSEIVFALGYLTGWAGPIVIDKFASKLFKEKGGIDIDTEKK